MKSSNIISLIKKNKNRQYLVKFYRGECLGSPHTGYGGVNTYQLLRLCNAYMFKSRIPGVSKKREVENRFYMLWFITSRWRTHARPWSRRIAWRGGLYVICKTCCRCFFAYGRYILKFEMARFRFRISVLSTFWTVDIELHNGITVTHIPSEKWIFPR